MFNSPSNTLKISPSICLNRRQHMPGYWKCILMRNLSLSPILAFLQILIIAILLPLDFFSISVTFFCVCHHYLLTWQKFKASTILVILLIISTLSVIHRFESNILGMGWWAQSRSEENHIPYSLKTPLHFLLSPLLLFRCQITSFLHMCSRILDSNRIPHL